MIWIATALIIYALTGNPGAAIAAGFVTWLYSGTRADPDKALGEVEGSIRNPEDHEY